jgi:hypothetical protein
MIGNLASKIAVTADLRVFSQFDRAISIVTVSNYFESEVGTCFRISGIA